MVLAMPEDTLAQIAGLLEEAINVHECVRNIVVCTTEGVVVAAVSKDERIEPSMLATVSAALMWASQSALHHVGGSLPTHLIHDTRLERILVLLQPHYQLVLVLSKSVEAGFNLEEALPVFHSVATRVEILIGSSETLKHEDLLGTVVTAIPEIKEAMLVTLDGLPLATVGFKEHIEVAALAGSIFANGLTYSGHTRSISISADRVNFIVLKVDDNRLLVAVCRGDDPASLCKKLDDLVEEGLS